MPTQREITNADLWAAIRGVGMMSMSIEDVRDLATAHSGKDAFASRVIASAARQVLAIRKREG